MLKHLTLENFRNYQKFSLDFSKTTILIGPNGIGKTNILEAIYLLATGRSWRTWRDIETIAWTSDWAKITGTAKDKLTLEMFLQKGSSFESPQSKIVKIAGARKKLTDLLGKMTVVLFSSESINVIDGSPVLRRRMIDILICQIDHRYTVSLLELAKVIRGRNKLLYFIKIGRSQEKELAFWDEKLVDLGSLIISKRQETIEFLNQRLTAIYRTISGQKETLTLKYKPSVLPADFAAEINRQRSREIEKTSTLLGPHRDDLIFILDGRDITAFGSRGEYRSAILALKMAELGFLKEKNEHEPILLLDDIFSELDASRRLHLAKIVSGQQTIITTTDLDHIEKNLREKGKIVELGRF